MVTAYMMSQIFTLIGQNHCFEQKTEKRTYDTLEKYRGKCIRVRGGKGIEYILVHS